MSAAKKISYLSQVRKDLKSGHTAIKTFLRKVKTFTSKEEAASLQKLLKKEQDRQEKFKKKLLDKARKAEEEMNSLLKKETRSLQNKILKLKQAQATSEANNFLLERKRKDLLIQTEEMELSNDKITNQNEELLQQKHQIEEQVDELNRTRSEILERKNELEEKMNALLDQTDYLHEANQMISNMHAELAKQKDEILSKNQELLDLNQEKNNLIGIVAHDLKSPLNQIKGLVSIIKSTSTLDDDTANCLSMIETSAQRLGDMISKILDIEAIEAHKLNLNVQRINLTTNIRSIIDRFEQEANEKQIQLNFSSESDFEIEADSAYINQIFENLVSNAIKFSPSGKNIWISLSKEDICVIVKVKDEGPGLSDDDKKKLFNKYQKLSARPTGNESSTGLGLSIVKKYVEAMKGKIWCESEYGKGAVFLVQFAKV